MSDLDSWIATLGLNDLDPWVAALVEARDYDELDRSQASWSRAVCLRCDPRARSAALVSIAGIGRARWGELADQYAWTREARAEHRRGALEWGPSSTDLAELRDGLVAEDPNCVDPTGPAPGGPA